MHSLATAFMAVVEAVATAARSEVQPRTAVEKKRGRWAQQSEGSCTKMMKNKAFYSTKTNWSIFNNFLTVTFGFNL
jgi:hypothetical protein